MTLDIGEYNATQSLYSQEARADTAIEQGDLITADSLLERSIQEAYDRQETVTFYRCAMKQLALPLHRDIMALESGGRLEESHETEALYGQSGELLEALLHDEKWSTGNPQEIAWLYGSLAEMAVFTLGARMRSYYDYEKTIIVPSTAEDDQKAASNASDFRIFHQQMGNGYWSNSIQVKHRYKPARHQYTIPVISYVGIQGLSRDGDSLALAPTIVRELNGQADTSDIAEIERASDQLLWTAFSAAPPLHRE